MKTFVVQFSKTVTYTGQVEVEAVSAEKAEFLVESGKVDVENVGKLIRDEIDAKQAWEKGT